MHVSILYNQETEQLKRQAAISDMLEWLGDTRFDGILKGLQDYKPQSTVDLEEQYELMLSFAGIQGYPAKVFISLVKGEIDEEGNETLAEV